MNVLWRRGHLPHYLFRVLCKEIRPAPSLNVSCLYNTLGARTEVQSLKPSNLSYNPIRCKSKRILLKFGIEMLPRIGHRVLLFYPKKKEFTWDLKSTWMKSWMLSIWYRNSLYPGDQKDEDSDDEDGDIFEDDTSLTKDSKVVKLNTTSLRMDAILKSTLGVARNKIEKLFYESKIRVNGKKILKKSIPVRVDYEIDVIKSVSPKNPEHLYVARVEILSIAAKEESITITARRFKNLLIENYETDPYKPSTADVDK